ncbi:DUF835 domain-containing protein [Thermococcus sp.]|uniref:DUF835 domain-containing protein n=1 Tax=Thermococcus sp. TaxID=35749 RepID=UPI00260D65D9|nr:DUF835 domain-containing protein [Thermococcus sp.]
MMSLRNKPRSSGRRVVDYRRLPSILKVSAGNNLVISRRPPEELEKYGVDYIWVAKVPHPKAVPPSKLHVIEQEVWDRLQREGSNVILDATEYLIIENGVEPTLRFIGKLRDITILHGGEFYVTVSDGLEGRVLSVLRRIVE